MQATKPPNAAFLLVALLKCAVGQNLRDRRSTNEVGNFAYRVNVHDRAERVESQAHDDCFFVTEATHNLCCNRAEDEVATSEVGDLKTGRFKLGDTQYPLEMRVEHIEETVGETLLEMSEPSTERKAKTPYP